MTYAGFWRRLGAFWVDIACLLPLGALSLWGNNHYRLFSLWNYLPVMLIDLWFYVFLVQRYGGTPGKLLLRMRIVKLDGAPVGYREAFLRYVVEFVLGAATSAALVLAALGMTDVEYHALGFQQRMLRLSDLRPAWYPWAETLLTLWLCGEFVVMLTNKKRRAAHDFIAGTVVVCWPLADGALHAAGVPGEPAADPVG